MIEDLLALKDKVDDLVERSFEGEAMFVVAVKDSFEHAVNRRQNKPAELLGWDYSCTHTLHNCVCMCWY